MRGTLLKGGPARRLSLLAAGVAGFVAAADASAVTDRQFRDLEVMNPKTYGCELDRNIIVISGDVHRELDRLLAGQSGALDANEVVAFYERRMGEPIRGRTYRPRTATMLEVLAACGVHIVS